MTPYINPSFRDRQEPMALLPGAIEDHVHVPGPGMSPAFRARRFDFIEAQSREVTPAPAPSRARGNRHAAYCVSLAFPIIFAIWSVVIGDFRLAMILLLMTLFMAVVGLFTLDGPP